MRLKDFLQAHEGEKSLPENLNTECLAAQSAFVRRVEYLCQETACLSCGKCREGCPTKAIFSHRSCPVIDPCLCIDCGWCQEHCPVGAILRTVQLTPV